MKDITLGQGQTIRDTITVDEEGAVSATFVATDGDTNLIEEVFSFDGLVATVTVTDTIHPPGSYDYYYKILWDDDTVDYIPNLRDCEDECEFPQLIICEIPEVS